MRIEEIENAIEPVVTSHGCELWGIELLRGKKRPTIRVYIDAIAGATIDDCEKVAKDLNYELALNDAFLDQDYVLEVSTPGIDRKFFKPEQLSFAIIAADRHDVCRDVFWRGGWLAAMERHTCWTHRGVNHHPSGK